MNAIEVKNVSKRFKNFLLKDVTLTLEKGYIMGLIGSNGAGKTTLIKIIMGLYLKDLGSVAVLGSDPFSDYHIKEQIGFVYDNPNFYDFKLKKIIKIIKPFYKNWDQPVFDAYLEQFKLTPKLRFKTMSRGMKLKFALAIALSHHAKVLILDEPTSGLDPVFRSEFLSILQEIISEEDLSILFSSHITSDIEKIADYITYIRDGEIIFSEDRHSVFSKYQLIKSTNPFDESLNKQMVGYENTPYNYSALIVKDQNLNLNFQEVRQPTLEEIMYFHERGDTSAHFN